MGLLDSRDPADSLLLALVELEEHGGTGPFPMGKTVEEGEGRVVRETASLSRRFLGDRSKVT